MSKRFNITKATIISTWNYKVSHNTDCPICYNNISSTSVTDLDKGQDSTIKTNCCGHAFHTNCIDPWIKNNPRCPLCVIDWK